jgi:hypothetical protein
MGEVKYNQHAPICSGSQQVSVRAVMCRGNENRGIDEQIHYREEGCSLASASKKRCRERVIRRLATLSSIANRTVSPSVSAFKSRCSSFTLRRSTITSFCAIDLFAAFPMDANPFSSFSMIRTSLVKVKHQMIGQGTGIFFRGFPNPYPSNRGSQGLSNRKGWRPRRDLNPCYRRERPVSWAGLDDGDAVMSRAGFEPATLCLKGRCSTA